MKENRYKEKAMTGVLTAFLIAEKIISANGINITGTTQALANEKGFQDMVLEVIEEWLPITFINVCKTSSSAQLAMTVASIVANVYKALDKHYYE